MADRMRVTSLMPCTGAGVGTSALSPGPAARASTFWSPREPYLRLSRGLLLRPARPGKWPPQARRPSAGTRAGPVRALRGGETSPAATFPESSGSVSAKGVAAPVGVRAVDVVPAVGGVVEL